MLAILLVVLPIFLVIGAGAAAVRGGVFADAGVDALMQFTTRVSVPCLLFTEMYRLSLGDAFEPGMLIAFYTGAFACFGLAVIAALRFGRKPGEAVAIGFSAYFSNTVLLGLPVMIRAYGDEATEPMFGLIAFHAPLLFAFGSVMMEVMREEGGGAVQAARRAFASIIRNALMIGIGLGLILNLLAAPLPAPALDALDLIAAASLPTALFALGAAMTRYRISDDLAWAGALCALSLIVHPAIAYGLSVYVFALDDAFLRAAVVTAAMPAGLNTYIFAVLHRRAEAITASAVLMGTALSVLSISFWLAILGGAA
ncbi:MAG: AEC family transporter [Pseudomonadota bacterium]